MSDCWNVALFDQDVGFDDDDHNHDDHNHDHNHDDDDSNLACLSYIN